MQDRAKLEPINPKCLDGDFPAVKEAKFGRKVCIHKLRVVIHKVGFELLGS